MSLLLLWVLFFLVVVIVVVFPDKVSLCSSSFRGTHFEDQAGLELRDPPASTSQVLGLKVCATTAQLGFFVCFVLFF